MMNQDISIAYTNTLDDMVAFNKYHHDHSPVLRRQWRISAWVFAIIVFYLSAISALFGGTPKYLFAGILLIGAGLWLQNKWLYPGTVRKLVTRMYKEGRDKGIFHRMVLRVDDDGLFMATRNRDEKIYWPAVERVVRDARHTYIYIGPIQAYVIPEARIESGDLDAFLCRLNQEVGSRSA